MASTTTRPSRGQKGGGLKRGLHADDRQPELLTELPSGHACGGVARQHNGLAVKLNQLVNGLVGIAEHLVGRLVAVGDVPGIAEVDIVLPRKAAKRFPEHADAAKPAVKHANGSIIQSYPPPINDYTR